jgi:hypothetical protein
MVHRCFGPQNDAPVNLDNILRRQGRSDGRRLGIGPLRAERQLNEACSITQMNEQDATQVSAPMYPPGQRNGSVSEHTRQLSTGSVPESGRAPIRRLDP